MGDSSVIIALLCITLAGVGADDLEDEMMQLGMRKIIRAMTNQTKADSLNLPSNATSIRENIIDTFSCEGRDYGYYADVDNDCQLFHVCLPSRSASGRNQTYRWSFICPEETLFNQEVLVCTRPKDSINCSDSPMYYDVNKEIGKVENNTNEEPVDYDNDKPVENDIDNDKPVNEIPKEIQPASRRRKPVRRGRSKRITEDKVRLEREEIKKLLTQMTDDEIEMKDLKDINDTVEAEIEINKQVEKVSKEKEREEIKIQEATNEEIKNREEIKQTNTEKLKNFIDEIQKLKELLHQAIEEFDKKKQSLVQKDVEKHEMNSEPKRKEFQRDIKDMKVVKEWQQNKRNAEKIEADKSFKAQKEDTEKKNERIRLTRKMQIGRGSIRFQADVLK